SEPRLEGLRAWFDHVMDRASQRFAFEARLVTIVLSCIFVFAAHFDSARLFRSMSEEAELRARLAASAEALDKHAEQLSRPKENAHTVVPDVYRKAMVSILRTAPAIPEPAKRKARSKKREKVAATAAPAEDRVTSEAKSKAMHALETSPGFASREEAESWLRATLDGNSARETLAAILDRRARPFVHDSLSQSGRGVLVQHIEEPSEPSPATGREARSRAQTREAGLEISQPVGVMGMAQKC